MKVLGIDPGLTATGYCIIENQAIIEVGTIRPKAGGSNARIMEICARIQRLIAENDLKTAVLEKAFHERNVASLIRLSELRGALIHTLLSDNLDVGEYTPAQIKLTTTGNGRASKVQVRFFVERLFENAIDKVSNHAIDALAIAYTGARKLSCKKP